MANVITIDEGMAMSYMIRPEQSPMNYQYMVDYYDGLSAAYGNVGINLIDKARAAFETAHNSEIAIKAKLAQNVAKELFHPNTIMSLVNLDEIRNAMPVMQRYIMAEPYIRGLLAEQRCSGYVDTYFDAEPGKIGEDHYDYRRVMHGVVTTNGCPKDPEDAVMECTAYSEELREGDVELNYLQQASILLTWEIARALAEDGEDPTEAP